MLGVTPDNADHGPQRHAGDCLARAPMVGAVGHSGMIAARWAGDILSDRLSEQNECRTIGCGDVANAYGSDNRFWHNATVSLSAGRGRTENGTEYESKTIVSAYSTVT